MATGNRANSLTLDAEGLAARLGLWANGDGPLYRQLARSVTDLVRSGALRDGDRLPAERALATCLSVSRGTVVAAYDLLREAGDVQRVQGRGTTVRTDVAAVEPAHHKPVADELFHPSAETIDLLMAIPEMLPGVFARLRAVDLDVSPAVLANCEPAGIPALRSAIADRMTLDGLPSTPEQILVTAGAQQAISLLVTFLTRPGDVVITEDTTWPGLADTVRRIGGRVVGAPMDADGVIVEEVAALVERFRPAFIGVNPHHHNPTGSRLSPARRESLAELAASYRVPLIEDRVAAFLAFDGNVPPPLAVHQPHATSIVVDSVNKSAWPGVRLGWIRADVQLVNDLRSSRALVDLFSPIPSQLMALALLEDLDAIRRSRIDQLATRASVLQSEVARHLPDWELAPIRGGLSGWARLPYGSATHVTRVAARHGVSVASGRAFSTTPEFDDHVRLPFTAPEDVLREAITRLGAAWRQLPRSEPMDEAGVATIV